MTVKANETSREELLQRDVFILFEELQRMREENEELKRQLEVFTRKIKKPEFLTEEWYLQKKDAGMSDRDIAAKLFVSFSTLYAWKKELGFNKRRAGRLRISTPEHVKELYAQGLTYVQISEQLGCGISTVQRYLRRYE